jgi:hypothetical protein
MSRRKVVPFLSSSRQMTIAWKVSGLSHKPDDHHHAASFDTLGDRDLALPREQIDSADLAQIQANGIVGVLGR